MTKARAALSPLRWLLAVALLASCALGLRLPAHRAVAVAGRTRLAMSSMLPVPQEGDEYGTEDEVSLSGDGVVIRKTRSGMYKKRDNRDQLPFRIYVPKDQTLGEEDYVLGSFRLDATTAVGDVLDLGPKGTYSVVRVRFLYRYMQNRLLVTSKKLEVVPLSTSALPFLQ